MSNHLELSPGGPICHSIHVDTGSSFDGGVGLATNGAYAIAAGSRKMIFVDVVEKKIVSSVKIDTGSSFDGSIGVIISTNGEYAIAVGSRKIGLCSYSNICSHQCN